MQGLLAGTNLHHNRAVQAGRGAAPSAGTIAYSVFFVSGKVSNNTCVAASTDGNACSLASARLPNGVTSNDCTSSSDCTSTAPTYNFPSCALVVSSMTNPLMPYLLAAPLLLL